MENNNDVNFQNNTTSDVTNVVPNQSPVGPTPIQTPVQPVNTPVSPMNDINVTTPNTAAPMPEVQPPVMDTANTVAPTMSATPTPDLNQNPMGLQDLNNAVAQGPAQLSSTVDALSTGKKVNPIIPVIIVLLVLGAVGAGGYLFLRNKKANNPVYITTQLFEKLEKGLKEGTKEAQKVLNSKKASESKLSGDLTFNDQKIEFSANFGSDLNQKIMNSDIMLKIAGENILNSNVMLTKDKAYLQLLKDSGNTYYYADDFSKLFEILDTPETDTDALLNIPKYFSEAFSNNIKQEDFTKSDAEITVDGKKLKTTKFLTVLNKEKMAPVVHSFTASLKNDKGIEKYYNDIMDQFNDLFTTFSEEVTEELPKYSEFLDQMEISTEYEDLTYALYMDGSNLARIELIDSNNDRVTIDFVGDKAIITMPSDEDSSAKCTVVNNDEKLVLDFVTINRGTTISLNITNNKKTGDFSFNFNDSIIITGTIKNTDNSSEISMNFEIKSELENMKGNLKVTSEAKDKLDIKVPTNAMDINTSSEEFAKELKESPLYSLIESMMPSTSYDYDYNFDYDFDSDFNSNYDFEF